MTQLRDKESLQDIVNAAQLTQQFISGLDRGLFGTDRKTQSAVIRQLEIIGEAANRVSKQTQVRFPEVPWLKIISMRNRLIHAYDDIELGIVWKTATVELQILVKAIEEVLAKI